MAVVVLFGIADGVERVLGLEELIGQPVEALRVGRRHVRSLYLRLVFARVVCTVAWCRHCVAAVGGYRGGKSSSSSSSGISSSDHLSLLYGRWQRHGRGRLVGEHAHVDRHLGHLLHRRVDHPVLALRHEQRLAQWLHRSYPNANGNIDHVIESTYLYKYV